MSYCNKTIILGTGVLRKTSFYYYYYLMMTQGSQYIQCFREAPYEKDISMAVMIIE